VFSRKNETDDERLLRLFRNRTELKTEFSKLRLESDRLRDQVRQQESALLRAQQRLELIEGILGDHETAPAAVVYYQLRTVWQHNRHRLQRFVAELRAAQESRERQQQLAAFESERNQAIQAIDLQLADLTRRTADAQMAVDEAQAELESRKGFWNYFRRRKIHEQLAEFTGRRDTVRAQQKRVEDSRTKKSDEAPPEPAGLSIEGRRTVNLAVIGLAQQLLVHFEHYGLGSIAREASMSSVTEVSYGDVDQCRSISGHIETALAKLEEGADLSTRVRARTEHLKANVHYRQDADAVPIAGTLAEIPIAIPGAGHDRRNTDRPISINILADGYWDIYAFLLG
jgi:hypothetical protein